MSWEVSFADMCRACMKIDGVLLHMFDDDQIKWKKLPDKLAELTSVKINRSDGLPTMLCAKCAYRTDAFYEFKLQVQETEQKLRKMLDTHTQQMDEVQVKKKKGRVKRKKAVVEKFEAAPEESLDNENIVDSITIEYEKSDYKTEEEPLISEIECIENEESLIHILTTENQETDNDALPMEESCINDEEASKVKEILVKPHVINEDSSIIEETLQPEKTFSIENLEKSGLKDPSLDISKLKTENRCTVETIDCKDRKTMRVEKQYWQPLFTVGLEVEGELSDEEEEILGIVDPNNDVSMEQEIISELSLESDNNVCGTLNDSVIRIKEVGTKNGKLQYQCTLCLKNYEKLTGVLLHTVDNHVPSSGPFFCMVCEKDCESQAQLRTHVKTHTGQFPYTCFLCNKAYSMKRYLKRHMVCHTDFPRYRCPKCGIRYKIKSELEDHITTHINNAPYECSQCSRIFNHKSNYKRHLISHHLDPHGKHLPKYPCKVCGKRFLNNRTLITHMRVHTGEKPFKCDICNKSFSQQGNLINHGKIHSNPRSYTCEVCGKRFNQRATLRDHSLLHTGEKPYVCSVCNMAFTFSAALRRHAWTHADGKPFRCDTCGSGFIGKYDLKRHMRIHSDRPRTRRRRRMIEGDLEESVAEMPDNENETILIEQVLLNEDTMQIISQDETEKENVTLFSLIQCG